MICIQEYIDFCKGVPKDEAVDYIADNVAYDYDIENNDGLTALIRSMYDKKEKDMDDK